MKEPLAAAPAPEPTLIEPMPTATVTTTKPDATPPPARDKNPLHRTLLD